MDTTRIISVAGSLIAVISIIVAVVKYEGIMAIISLFTLAYGIIWMYKCPSKPNQAIPLAAVLGLICTVLSVTVLTPDNFMDGDDPSTLWFVLIGLVHTVPLVPLTLSSFVVIASFSSASYNWALVGYLSPFIGMGIEVPGFVLEYVFQGSDNWMTDNGYILFHFLMSAIVLIVVSYFVSKAMRERRIIINGEGVGEMQ